MKTSIVRLMQLVINLLSPRSFAVHILAAISCGAAALPALADTPGVFRFVDTGQRLGNLLTTGIELADLDKDGDLDAITPTYLGPAAIWLNQGDGVMIEAANRIGSEFFTSDFELADFSGDGFVDLLAPNLQSSSTLFLNDGTGQFELFQTFPRAGSSAVAAGDLDGDGDLDAMFGHMSGNSNAPAFNDGTGRLTVSSNGNGPPASSISLGDLDGDGDLDAFVAIGTTQSFANWVLFNDGNGFFTDSGQRLGDGLSATVQIGDLDLDGDLDAFVINVPFEGHSAADMVWLNDGNGTFADSGQRLGEEYSGDLDLADFDDDGDLDALICLANAPDIVRINDGAGRFESTVMVDPTEPQFFKSAVGDLDGDGDVDVFTARTSAHGDRVYLNEPTQNVLVPDALTVFRGVQNGGTLEDVFDSDDQYLILDPEFLSFRYQLEFTVDATSPSELPSGLEFSYESRVFNFVGTVDQKIELFDYDTGQFESVDTRLTTPTDTVVSIKPGGDPTRFVQAGTNAMRARISYQNSLPFWVFSTQNLYLPYRVRADHIFWTITP